MTVFVCVDDSGGMLFNGRRQSRDARLIADAVASADGGTLYISNFSEDLFEDSEACVISVPNPLECAREGAFAFVEVPPLSPYKDKISTLVIYRWNRKYPKSASLDLNPQDEGMKLSSTYEFTGKSHEKITKEIYVK